MLGETAAEYNFEQLKEYGVDCSPVTMNRFGPLTFNYNNVAKKNIRLHSKKCQLILECLHQLNFAEKSQAIDRDRIGLYIMGSHYNLDQEFPSYLPFQQSQQSLYSIYKSSLAPTHGVKSNTGILPGHISIFHDIHGPSFVMTSNGPAQILQKAWMDLESGLIDLAVVGLVNDYDDPMVAGWHAKKQKGKTLTEAAGVLLIAKGEAVPVLKKDISSLNYFGYLEGLV